jgi:hypothetical protein
MLIHQRVMAERASSSTCSGIVPLGGLVALSAGICNIGEVPLVWFMSLLAAVGVTV